jgi:hypothetical protein
MVQQPPCLISVPVVGDQLEWRYIDIGGGAVGSLATAGSSPLGRPEPTGTQLAPLTLSLAEMRTLCVVVAAGMGLVVAETRDYRSHTDVFLECTVLLYPRRVLIRLTVEQAIPSFLYDAVEEARRRDCADYLI